MLRTDLFFSITKDQKPKPKYLQIILVWIRFTGTNDPNLMIGKFEMDAGYFGFWHVTRNAVLFGFGADNNFCLRFCSLLFRLMTGQTFCIVKSFA